MVRYRSIHRTPCSSSNTVWAALLLSTILLLGTKPLHAQSFWSGLAPAAEPTVPCLDSAEQARIAMRIQTEIGVLEADGRLVVSPSTRSRHPEFAVPVRAKRGADYFNLAAISSLVDHNAFTGRQDYACGTRTYNAHTGTDFFPWPFAWMAMDSNWAEVVAAAPGIIVYKEDGNNDRICDGSGSSWNAVYVQHADGSVAWYGHLKSGSLTPKGPGDAVITGEFLGIIGSSGNSTGPHLHFEVRDADGSGVDPFTGSCNDLNLESWWVDQEPYQVSTVNKLVFHHALPEFGACGTASEETPNIRRQFYAGEDVYLGIYIRDPKVGQKLNIRILKPDGTLNKQWERAVTTSGAAGYEIAHLKINRNPQFGEWTARVQYESQWFSETFRVCMNEEICTCNKPGSLRQIPLESHTTGLYWSGPENGEEYQVRLESNGRTLRNFFTESNNIDIAGLSTETSLTWQVRARCGYVMSAWSIAAGSRPVILLPDLPDTGILDPPLREASGWHWPDLSGIRLTLYDLSGQVLVKSHGDRLNAPYGLTPGLYLLEKQAETGTRSFARVSW
ncbi:MAG: peptidoglycan DD-metalloendopeptidase family protein [Bacteroidetes bacterium]|nr:peptidoglycan DD-metalloendopeptidase family protein [Bacteroidota bacterium]